MAGSYLHRRWQNTVSNTWPGWSREIAVVNGLGLIAAVASSLYFGGLDFTVGELKSWALFTLAWIGAANLAFLTWNWLLAPSRLEKEDADKIAALSSELEQWKKQDKLGIERSIANKKREIAKQLALMKSLATEYGAWTKANFRNEHGEKYASARSLAKSKIEEIAFDKQLRNECIDFIQLCETIRDGDQALEMKHEEREQLHHLSESLMKRLHGQG